MARQFLIPGVGYVNADANGLEFLIPGQVYFNEEAGGGGPITGSGALVANSAILAGEGFSGSFGQTVLVAQLAAIAGEGFSGSFGSGELQADNVSVEGYDITPPVTGSYMPNYRPRRR